MNQTAAVNGSGNIIVQAQGSGLNIQIGDLPHLTLVPHHRRGRPPRRLLEVLNGFVTQLPLIGREAELAGFKAWLDRPAPIAVGGLVGEAGSGKSRLAIEICARAEADGWLAGFLTHAELDRFFEKQNSSAWGWDRPTLVVVDYAAAKTARLKQWLEELALNDRAEPRLRLLLVERHADPAIGWWKDLCSASSPGAAPGLADMVDGAPLLRLPGLEEVEQRQALVEAVRQTATPLIRSPSPLVPALAELARLIREPNRVFLPLDLAMATVIALQAGDHARLGKSRPEMAFILAGFERSRLQRFAADHRVDPAVIEQMAALVTLAGGLSRDALAEQLEAEARAENWPPLPGGFDHSLLEVLQAGGAEAQALQPDLIGGAFVLAVMEKQTPRQSGQRILRWYRSCPTIAGALIRLGQDFGDIAAGKPGLAWLDAVVGSIKTTGELIALAAQFPEQTISLREIVATLTSRIVEGLRQFAKAAPGDESGLAARGKLSGWLNDQSNRLSDLGRREEALAASEEAVGLYRSLAAARPDAFTPYLALALNTLSNRLYALGRHEAALTASQKAVELYRTLAAARPNAFTPYLASSLNNLSVFLSDLGRREEALAASDEAVAIRRALAAARPDAFTPGLARSLSVLADVLEANGNLPAAIERDQQAISALSPFFLALPPAFAALMRAMVQDYLRRSESSGSEPDAALLAPIVEIFQRLQQEDNGGDDGPGDGGV